MKCGIAPHAFLQTVCCRVEEKRDVERALNGISVIGTILMTTVVVYPSKACLPHSLCMGFVYEDVKCGIAPHVFLRTVCCRGKVEQDVEKASNGILVIGTIVTTPVVVYLSRACLPHTFHMG